MAAPSRPGREKRSSTRIEIKLSTSLVLVRIDSYHSGIIGNISEGGCYFPVDQELPIGEKCLIEVVLGDGLDVNTVSLSGRIARNDSHGAGIEFVDNHPETTAILKKMLSHYSHPA
jgi:hypothetical protein